MKKLILAVLCLLGFVGTVRADDPTGACCIQLVCVPTTYQGCIDLGAESDPFVIWTGAASCTPNPCYPRGACCVNGTCSIWTMSFCTYQAGGIYLGDFIPCLDIPDVCDLVGCCVDGSCYITSKYACDLLNGTISSQTCSNTVCSEIELHPCCLGYYCSLMTAKECDTSNGQYLSGTCEPANVCDPITVCCVGQNCILTEQSLCQGLILPNTTCTSQLCNIVFGACCFHNGSCEVRLMNDCPPGQFTYQNQPCQTTNCAGFMGGCCNTFTGVCTIEFHYNCYAPNLIFYGLGSTCVGHVCEEVFP